MGYLSRDVRKSNLAILLALVIVVAAAVGAVVSARHSDNSSPGDNASDVRLGVEGAAPKGVAVTFSDSNGASVLERDARLPFQRSVPVNGGSFYELQAQVLGSGTAKISCRIALGRVVSVHHASGGHTCVAGVGYGRAGWSAS